MKVSFELTMPNNNAWNGKWTGASKKYYYTYSARTSEQKKAVNDLLASKSTANFYYNFGDGWGANVQMEIVDDKESRRRTKISAGFCGYNWMIWSILKHGKILAHEPA